MYELIANRPVGTEVYFDTDEKRYEVWAFDPSITGPARSLKSGKRKFAYVNSKEEALELAETGDGLAVNPDTDTPEMARQKFAKFDRIAAEHRVDVRSTTKRAEERSNLLALLSRMPHAGPTGESLEGTVRALIAELNGLSGQMQDLRFAVFGDGRSILAMRLL